MAKPSLPVSKLKELIAAELRSIEAVSDIDANSVVLVAGRSGWMATLRREGTRIDEGRLAVVCEVSRRLSRGYDLST